MARAALTFGQWIQQFGQPQSSSFQSESTSDANRAGFAAYNQARQTELKREQATAERNSPAAVAQRRAEANFQQALDIIGANREMFASLGQPGDPGAQALINQELEFGASAAARAQNLARDRAASSGLGKGGGLNTAERLIQEEFNRRGIASMRDIRSGLLSEGRAGVARAGELAAGLFTDQGFELPESGQGTAIQSAFPTFNFATPGTTQSTATAAKAVAPVRKALTKLPTTTGERSFTARRF